MMGIIQHSTTLIFKWLTFDEIKSRFSFSSNLEPVNKTDFTFDSTSGVTDQLVTDHPVTDQPVTDQLVTELERVPGSA